MRRAGRFVSAGSLLAAFLQAAGCGDGPPTDAGAFELREVARYGWLDAPADTTTVSAELRRLDGGVLGRVAGLAQAGDSTLYVLDSEYRKIVAFAPDGAVRRVIAGGEGEGPGEFSGPVDLAIDGDGRLAALDYELGRVSFFTPDGELDDVVTLGATGRRLAVTGDTLWTTRPARDDEPSSLGNLWTVGGSPLDTLPALPAEDVAYGGGVLVAICPDGRVLHLVNRPGVWLEYDGGRWTRRGTPIWPDLDAPVVERTGPTVSTVVPALAESSGLACLPSGQVIQRYWRFSEPPEPEAEELPERKHFLGLYRTDGAVVGVLPIDETLGFGRLYVSSVTGHLFVAVEDPYPLVVEYALTRQSSSGPSP